MSQIDFKKDHFLVMKGSQIEFYINVLSSLEILSEKEMNRKYLKILIEVGNLLDEKNYLFYNPLGRLDIFSAAPPPDRTPISLMELLKASKTDS